MIEGVLGGHWGIGKVREGLSVVVSMEDYLRGMMSTGEG